MKNEDTQPDGQQASIPDHLQFSLTAAFGSSRIHNWQSMLGGRSGAIIFSFRVDGRTFVLRHLNPDRPDHRARVSREFICTGLASKIGVAPAVHHVDIENSVIISDRIQQLPIAASPRSADFTSRAAETLRRLHRGPDFPVGQPLTDSLATVNKRIMALGHPGLPVPLIDTLDTIAATLEPFAESAPCHLDLNPTNIFDTGDAIYFVDWEIAQMSDPFVDIGQLGVFVFPSPAMRIEFLTSYLGQKPNQIELARELLGRQIALTFYVAAFICLAVESGNLSAELPAALPLPDLFSLLATRPQEVSPALISSSLYEEMLSGTSSNAFKESIELLKSLC